MTSADACVLENNIKPYNSTDTVRQNVRLKCRCDVQKRILPLLPERSSHKGDGAVTASGSEGGVLPNKSTDAAPNSPLRSDFF